MSDLNKVQLIGRLGADPESRAFPNGGKVVNLRIATSETWKDKASGERKEKTEWHTVAIFSEGLGNVAERYLRKGSKVFIEGKLQTRKWQDQSGADRYSTEIVLQGYDANLIMLDGKPQGDDAGQSAHNQAKSNGYQPQTSGGFGGQLDDDVPFISCDIAFEGFKEIRV